MKKQFESPNIIKLSILVFCIINVIVLLVLLKKDSRSYNTVEAISYYLPEEDSSDAVTVDTPYPVLTLSEDLIPDLAQDDLYQLKDVLISAQALHAEDSQGNDITDRIEWTLTPVADQPGTFDAEFYVRDENRRSSGAAVTVSAELTSPFLMLTDDSVEVEAYSDFSIKPYIRIAMDINGQDLTEFVTTDDYVNTASTGTYNITLYVYSRQTDSMTRQDLTVTVR